jgi:hypothetical protein
MPQERLGDQSVVIFHKPDTCLAAAFSRTVNCDLLDFKLNEKSEIVDQQTGSIWNYAGVAQSGPLTGTQLDAVTCILEQWYMWAMHHEQITIYFR